MVIYRRGLLYTILSVLFLMCAPGSLKAATLEAVVDRNKVEFGQSVNLTITATGISGDIDFSILADDFDILDTRRSRNVSIINGKSDSSLVWQIGLMPLTTGDLKIPPFEIDGVQSAELVLSVQEKSAAASQGGPAGADFFLEISADKTEAYVQEQIILIARVYQARNIIEGSLSDPIADGMMLQRLGSDQTYAATLEGRQYNVIERRYAIFAQQSGEHTIRPLRLEASVRQKNRSNSNNGFFAPTQKIRVASNSLALNIKAKPANGKSGWWLPAETLSLTANWNEDISKARVDEPISRTISLAAKAVLDTQLPALVVPELEGAKIYPDQPDIQTQTDGDSLITYRTDKWAIIPRSAGPLTIPEVRVEWYDTINNKLQYAVLPEQVIDIQAAENTVVSDATGKSTVGTDTYPNTQADALMPENTAPVEANYSVDKSTSMWRLAFYSVLFLWLLTLGLWFWQQKFKSSGVKLTAPTIGINNNVSLTEVDEACRSGDPQQIVRSLLNFARKKWPDNTPLNIGELSARLNHLPLTTMLDTLDKAVYGKATYTTDFGSLAETLKAAINASKGSGHKSTDEKSLLPQL